MHPKQHRGVDRCREEHRRRGWDINADSDKLYREVVEFELPKKQFYATGIAFLSHDQKRFKQEINRLEEIAEEEDLEIMIGEISP